MKIITYNKIRINYQSFQFFSISFQQLILNIFFLYINVLYDVNFKLNSISTAIG